MAVVSYALTTRARVKTFLHITLDDDDLLIDSLINTVTDIVERFCDRRFQKTDYADEVYDGNGSNKILLKQYPVVSASAFTLERRDAYNNQDSWSTIGSESYFVQYNEGIVEYVGGFISDASVFVRAPRHYKFTYTAGYDFDNLTPGSTLVDVGLGDLEYAVWRMINNQDKSFNMVESEKIGDYSVKWREKLRVIDIEIYEILMKYKRPYGD